MNWAAGCDHFVKLKRPHVDSRVRIVHAHARIIKIEKSTPNHTPHTHEKETN